MAHLQSRSSEVLGVSAGAQVYTGRSALCGFLLSSATATLTTLTIHDGTSTAGKVLAKVIVPAAVVESQPTIVDFTRPVTAEIGLFYVLSGTGAEVVIYHN